MWERATWVKTFDQFSTRVLPEFFPQKNASVVTNNLDPRYQCRTMAMCTLHHKIRGKEAGAI